MNVLFTPDGWSDYQFWINDPSVLKRLNDLIEAIRRQPFGGIGKPEPLRGTLKGWWSRRITGEHRVVYRVLGRGDVQRVEIVSCRYHY